MHWTQVIVLTQLLQTLSGIIPTSPLVKSSENVQVSPCENTTGLCPEKSGHVDDVSITQ